MKANALTLCALVVTGCPSAATNGPGVVAARSEAVPPSVVATPPVETKAAPAPETTLPPLADERDLDAVVAAMRTAAAAHDVATLARYMGDDFATDMMGDEPSRDELLATWRTDGALMDRLAALLGGTCAFVGSRDHWVCPRGLVQDVLEYGDAERVHFGREDGRWRWVAFFWDDVSPARTVPRKLPPSKDPLLEAD